MSEREICTINQLLREAEDAYVALMEGRNSPVTGIGLSPSHILNSQRPRSKLPTMAQLLRPQVTLNAHERLGAAHQRQNFYCDRHAKPLKGSSQRKQSECDRIEPGFRRLSLIYGSLLDHTS